MAQSHSRCKIPDGDQISDVTYSSDSERNDHREWLERLELTSGIGVVDSVALRYKSIWSLLNSSG